MANLALLRQRAAAIQSDAATIEGPQAQAQVECLADVVKDLIHHINNYGSN